MINLAVIKLKDILKIIMSIVIIFLCIIIFSKCMKKIEKGEYYYFKENLNNKIVSCIGVDKFFGDSFVIYNLDDKKDIENKNVTKKILKSELLALEIDDNILENNIDDINLIVENDEIEDYNETTNINIPEVLETSIMKENNKIDKFTNCFSNVQIKNESKYELTGEMINADIKFNNKKDIIIYHTHTCESYTPSENSNYVSTGNYRTTDLNYSVAGVGTELKNNLERYNFNVIHNMNYHDYPAYTGSYTRGLNTINNLLKDNANVDFIIDLHRDALGSNNNYAPTVKIGDEVVAQIMFVIGSNGGGLEHPNWINNLSYAVKIQEKANQMYPGLFKPIILRDSRYNQHVSNAACIIEVGATGNTFEQCKNSMKYLAKVISEVMK